MKSLRFYLHIFVILFVSSSVVIDWNGFPFESSSKNVQATMLMEAYEDHNLKISHPTFKHFKIKIYKTSRWGNIFYDKSSTPKTFSTYFKKNAYIDVRCAVKSFLHLLQLY